ncbi:hypothetical protein VTN02DRAFT_93 [Thermoascus thermophilus]
MMKAHGINPNGGPAPSSPGPSSATTSPAKGKGGETTTTTTSNNNNGVKDGNDSSKKAGSGKQSPSKRKTATGTGTGTGAGPASASSKKAKVLTSAERIAVNTTVNVKEEGPDTDSPGLTYRNRDPLLSETADGHPDEAALFKEFCSTGGSSRAIRERQFEMVAPSNVNNGDEDDDATIQEEPDMA